MAARPTIRIFGGEWLNVLWSLHWYRSLQMMTRVYSCPRPSTCALLQGVSVFWCGCLTTWAVTILALFLSNHSWGDLWPASDLCRVPYWAKGELHAGWPWGLLPSVLIVCGESPWVGTQACTQPYARGKRAVYIKWTSAPSYCSSL